MRQIILFMTMLSSCAHHPQITPSSTSEDLGRVFVLREQGWVQGDGYLEDGPRFAPLLQSGADPKPHAAVHFLPAGTRLEVVATYEVVHREDTAELWAIATPAKLEECNLFVSIPLRKPSGGATHPFFPAAALDELDGASTQFDTALYRCASQRLGDEFARWVHAPT